MSSWTRGFRFSLALFFTLFLISCGSEKAGGGATPVATPYVPPAGASATLMLFGAPWCSNCKHEFPQIQALLGQLPPETLNKLAVELYVVTGGTAQDKPTAQIAEQYRDALAMRATAIADEWRWKRFRDVVGGALVLPGAAIVDSSGKVLHAYRAGATTFVPREIVNAASEAAK